jgi:hypothetical protein
MNEYPRETKENVYFEKVTVDGVPFDAFEYAITKTFERPEESDWAAVDTIGTRQAFLLDASTIGRGTYKVWVRIASAPQQAVIEAGQIRIQ